MEELQGNSESSQPAKTKDDAEARNDFWSMEGDFIYRQHIEPRVQLYVPRKKRSQFSLKYIDVTRTAHTNLDVLQENRLDDDVDRNLSDSWKGFTKFTSLNEKPPEGHVVPGGGLQRFKQQPDLTMCGLKFGPDVKSSSEEGEEEWAVEKPKFDNARRLKGVYFIDPQD